MKTFHYKAKNEINQIVKGEIRAENVSHLFNTLYNQQLFCLSYYEKKQFQLVQNKIKTKELAVMCKQMATMLKSGISLVNSLDVLRQKSETDKLKKMYFSLYEDVQKGMPLSLAFRQNAIQFPMLLVYLVQAGEMNGTLDQILLRMSEHFDSELKIHNKVSSAMVYPVILIVITIAVVIALMTSILPQFFSMFGDMKLPWYTQLLMDLSNFLTTKFSWVIIGSLLFVLGIMEILKQKKVIRFIDEMKMKLPIFGKLFQIIYTSQFARTFSSLYGSGIGVIEAIKVSSDVLNNLYLDENLEVVSTQVRKGESLSKSIEQVNIFDPLLNSMIYVGEQSGELEGILITAADYYDAESENATQKMVAMMEPMMILILAFIIFFVLMAVIVPIYQSYSTIQ